MLSRNRWMTFVLAGALLLSLSVQADEWDDAVAAYEANNYSKAYPLFEVLANAGDARAMWALGIMYGFGQGVKEDDAESVRWYRKAAKQGQMLAQYNILDYLEARKILVARVDIIRKNDQLLTQFGDYSTHAESIRFEKQAAAVLDEGDTAIWDAIRSAQTPMR